MRCSTHALCVLLPLAAVLAAAPAFSMEPTSMPTSMPTADAGPGEMGDTLAEQLDWLCTGFTAEIEDRARPLSLRLRTAQERVEAVYEGTPLQGFLDTLPSVDGDRYMAFVNHAAAHGVPDWSCPAIERAVAMMEAGEDDQVFDGAASEDFVRMCEIAEAVLDENIEPESRQRVWAQRVDGALRSRDAREAFEVIAYAEPSDRRELLEYAAVESGLEGFTCDAWGVLMAP